jgi:raffinose/stachyose/melibiose transport system substrate-binding protein
VNRRRTILSATGLLIALGLSAWSATAATRAGGNPLLGSFPTKKVTLTIWSGGQAPNTPQGKALSAIDARFTKLYPNVHINRVDFPYSVYARTKIQVAISTRRGPDLMQVYYSPTFWKGLWPLNGLIDKNLRKSLLFFGWDTSDPSLHQLPFTMYGYYWLYNKTLFAKAGITSPPTTWSQLLSTCSSLKAAGVTPMAAGFKDGYYGQWLISFGMASQLFSPADLKAWSAGKLGWTSPKMQAALQLLVQLKNSGCFGSGSEGKTLNDAQTDFLGQNAAMLYWYTGDFSAYEKQFGAGNVGIFRMPLVPNTAYPSHPIDSGPNMGLGITRWTKNCRVAWQYLSFIESPASQALMYKVAKAYPNNVNAPVKPASALDSQLIGWLKIPANHTGPSELGPQEAVAYLKGYQQLMAGQVSVGDLAQSLQDVRSTEQATHPTLEKTPVCR